MSEAVTGGIAAAGIVACLAVLGLAATAAAKPVTRLLTRLSEQGRRDMEALEKALAAPSTHATTKEARQAFEAAFKRARLQAAQLPSLKDHADTVARLLALKGSPLGAFMGQSQWTQISQPGLPAVDFDRVLDQAAGRFTKANARCVAQSIVTVAAREGFTQHRLDRQEESQGRRRLVLEDRDGRALVASVTASDEGAQITLDLTGFGDCVCLGVMDKLLSGLAEEGIRLDHLRRHSHYRREGSTPLAISYSAPAKQTSKAVTQGRNQSREVQSDEAARRRRQAVSRPVIQQG
jgi:hypothetical protein